MDRDARFLQVAVAIGVITAERARAILVERQADRGEAIESWLLRRGEIQGGQLGAILQHARGAGGLPPTPAPQSPPPLSPLPQITPSPPITPIPPLTPGSRASGSRDSRAAMQRALSERALLTPGQRLGPYTVSHEIARGGMGAVYRAVNPGGREVALKIMLSGEDASDKAIRRFEREVELTRALDHPGIVKLLDSGREGELLYFVMELVEGGSLHDLIGQEEPPLRERVAMLADVARAMGLAHAQGIIHRDLKPANVLLDSHGNPKVTDFGLARSLLPHSQLTKTGASIGTPSYMAPEQVRGETKQLDARCDVWALGVILYELLSDNRPFDAESLPGLYEAILKAAPPPVLAVIPEAEGGLDKVILKCLEREPKDRYPSGEELAADLETWLDSGVVSVIGQSAPSRFARVVARQHRGILVGLGALAVLALLAGGTWALLGEMGRRAAIEESKRNIEAARRRIAVAGERVPQWVEQAQGALAVDDTAAARESLERAVEALDAVAASLAELPDASRAALEEEQAARRLLALRFDATYELARLRLQLASDERRRLDARALLTPEATGPVLPAQDEKRRRLLAEVDLLLGRPVMAEADLAPLFEAGQVSREVSAARARARLASRQPALAVEDARAADDGSAGARALLMRCASAAGLELDLAPPAPEERVGAVARDLAAAWLSRDDARFVDGLALARAQLAAGEDGPFWRELLAEALLTAERPEDAYAALAPAPLGDEELWLELQGRVLEDPRAAEALLGEAVKRLESSPVTSQRARLSILDLAAAYSALPEDGTATRRRTRTELAAAGLEARRVVALGELRDAGQQRGAVPEVAASLDALPAVAALRLSWSEDEATRAQGRELAEMALSRDPRSGLARAAAARLAMPAPELPARRDALEDRALSRALRLFERAKRCESDPELERARACLDLARRWAPWDPRPVEVSLARRWAESDLSDAGEEAELLLSLKPGAALAEATLAQLALIRDELELSRQRAEAAVEAEPELSEARLVLARVLAKAGEVEAAREQLDALLTREPLHLPALRDRVVVLRALGEKASAAADETTISELTDDSKVDAWFPNWEERIHDDPEGMLALMDTSVRYHPRNAALRFQRALARRVAWNQTPRLLEAYADFAQVFLLHPQDIDAPVYDFQNSLSVTLPRETLEALVASAEASGAAIGSDAAFALAFTAYVEVSNDNQPTTSLRGLEARFDRALQGAPTSVAILALRGYARALLGDPAAELDLKRCEAIKPGLGPVALARVYVAMRRKRFREAVEVAKAARHKSEVKRKVALHPIYRELTSSPEWRQLD